MDGGSPESLNRFRTALRRLRPILKQQRARDVSEADTVTLVKEVLSQVLGYDKFTELTGQYQVRGQFCDLAIKLGESLTHLIEVKAVGVALSDRHLQQVLAYATNEGVEWVVLTNGIAWHSLQRDLRQADQHAAGRRVRHHDHRSVEGG